MSEYYSGQTQHSDFGSARATYRPEYDALAPWVTYTNGTARKHFPTLRGALSDLERCGYSFQTTTLI